MKGRFEGAKLIIELDINFEWLEAPGNKKYLPCQECGEIHAVQRKIISFLCQPCVLRHRSEARVMEDAFTEEPEEIKTGDIIVEDDPAEPTFDHATRTGMYDHD